MEEPVPTPVPVIINASDGTEQQPGYNFAHEITTGFYRTFNDEIGASTDGTSRMVISDDNVSMLKPVLFSDQITPGAPVFSSELRLYKKLGVDALFINTVGGGESQLASSGAPVIPYPLLANPSGTITDPVYSFLADSGAGLYHTAGTGVGLASGVGTNSIFVGDALRVTVTNGLNISSSAGLSLPDTGFVKLYVDAADNKFKTITSTGSLATLSSLTTPSSTTVNFIPLWGDTVGDSLVNSPIAISPAGLISNLAPPLADTDATTRLFVTSLFAVDVFEIYDPADPARRITFDLTAIDPATTQQVIIPNSQSIVPSLFSSEGLGIGATDYTAGAYNTFVGVLAGATATLTAQSNVVVGNGSATLLAGSNNILLGAKVQAHSTAAISTIVLGGDGVGYTGAPFDNSTSIDPAYIRNVSRPDILYYEPATGEMTYDTFDVVTGPVTSIANRIATWAGTTGDALLSSNLTVIGSALSGLAAPVAASDAVNKTYVDSRFGSAIFTVFDSADTSALLTFDLSAITTATTRTLTFPDEPGIVPALFATGSVGIGDLIYSAGINNVLFGDGVCIGATGAAISNVMLGTGCGTNLAGSGNVFIGYNISPFTAAASNTLVLGGASGGFVGVAANGTTSINPMYMRNQDGTTVVQYDATTGELSYSAINAVEGPVTTTTRAIAIWAGTTGAALLDSSVIVSLAGLISGVATPVADGDAATKAYVDTRFASDVFAVYDAAIPTKRMTFLLTALTAATTSIVTVPDSAAILPALFATGSVAVGDAAYVAGINNVFVGVSTGVSVSAAATGNTIVGRLSGGSLAGADNVFLGRSVTPYAAAANRTLVLGGGVAGFSGVAADNSFSVNPEYMRNQAGTSLVHYNATTGEVTYEAPAVLDFVTGPATSTVNAIATYADGNGNLLLDTTVTISGGLVSGLTAAPVAGTDAANKTYVDGRFASDVFAVYDAADVTKTVSFALAGLTTSTASVVTVPNMVESLLPVVMGGGGGAATSLALGNSTSYAECKSSVFVGVGAGAAATVAAEHNVIVGASAVPPPLTGSGNVFLGSNIAPFTAGATHTLVLGGGIVGFTGVSVSNSTSINPLYVRAGDGTTILQYSAATGEVTHAVIGSVATPATTTLNALVAWGDATGDSLLDSAVTVSAGGVLSGLALPVADDDATNKGYVDTRFGTFDFAIYDDVDPTKRLTFDLTAIGTGLTRTVQAPNAPAILPSLITTGSLGIGATVYAAGANNTFVGISAGTAATILAAGNVIIGQGSGGSLTGTDNIFIGRGITPWHVTAIRTLVLGGATLGFTGVPANGSMSVDPTYIRNVSGGYVVQYNPATGEMSYDTLITVAGPGVSTLNAVPTWGDATGDTLLDTVVTIAPGTGVISGVGTPLAASDATTMDYVDTRFSSANFAVYDAATPSKRVAFDITSFLAGGTKTVIMPNSNGIIAATFAVGSVGLGTSTYAAGTQNTFIGDTAGANAAVTATDNVIVGTASGTALQGSGNIFIGPNISHYTALAQNTLVIGGDNVGFTGAAANGSMSINPDYLREGVGSQGLRYDSLTGEVSFSDRDVIGPSTTTINAIATWGDTSGSTLLDSAVSVSAGGVISGVATPILATDGANKDYVDTRFDVNNFAVYDADASAVGFDLTFMPAATALTIKANDVPMLLAAMPVISSVWLVDAAVSGFGGAFNVVMGYQAGDGLTTGASNVAIGALSLGKSGVPASGDVSGIVAIGYQALTNMTADVVETVVIGRGAMSGTSQVIRQAVAVGAYAMANATSTVECTAVGAFALNSISSGDKNVAVGQQAMHSATTAGECVAIGAEALAASNSSGQTAVGYKALNLSTTAFNTAVGHQAAIDLTSGTHNVAIGYGSMSTAQGASDIIAIGYQSMGALAAGGAGGRTSGNENVAIGAYTMGMITGASNVTIGHGAARKMGNSTLNVVVGWNAFRNATTSGHCVAMGAHAMLDMVSGGHAVALGYRAMQNLTNVSGCVAIGSDAMGGVTQSESVAIGFNSMLTATGENSVAIGYNTLNVCSGSANIAIGDGCMFVASTASSSVGIGSEALLAFTTGSDTVAIGHRAGKALTTTVGNTAIGWSAYYQGTGTQNTCVGRGTIGGSGVSNNNTCVGFEAGQAITTGSGNTYIGHVAGRTLATTNNRIIIGAPTSVETFVYGIDGIGVTGAPVLISTGDQLGVSTSSRRYKTDISSELTAGWAERAYDLQPVHFRYKTAASEPDAEMTFGLIAEDVHEIFPELAIWRKGVIESVAYHVMPTLNLDLLIKQKRTIEVAAVELAAVKARVAELEGKVAGMEALEARLAALEVAAV